MRINSYSSCSSHIKTDTYRNNFYAACKWLYLNGLIGRRTVRNLIFTVLTLVITPLFVNRLSNVLVTKDMTYSKTQRSDLNLRLGS